jgi:Raf kinase inhibitor-like YbhB/YbcL family protein
MKTHRLTLSVAPLLLLLLSSGCGGDAAEDPTDPAPIDVAEESPTGDQGEASTEPAGEDDEVAAANAAAGIFQPTVRVDDATGFWVNSSSIPTAAGTVIGGINAFCEPADSDHVRNGGNISPHINWGEVPDGTKSFALLMHDPDVPASFDDANQDNVFIEATAPRQEFVHWVLVDIPATLKELPEGVQGRGVVVGGKPQSKGEHGLSGLNDFTPAFAGDPTMKGAYHGYDGPCPPWNDNRMHRYVFTLHAIDVETLGLSGAFDAGDVRAKMEGHVLGRASFTGIYWVNPGVQPPAAP